MAAGEPFGVTPYGTEAMHVLRAEKGYVIVGQETDGTVTPARPRAGLGSCRRRSEFIGRRSLRRPDTTRADRKQLVGLLPLDPDAAAARGRAADVEPDAGARPVPMLGHVTSSYRSAALGRTFALALLASGRERHGETVYAPLPRGQRSTATVVDPVLYDAKGTRRDG